MTENTPRIDSIEKLSSVTIELDDAVPDNMPRAYGKVPISHITKTTYPPRSTKENIALVVISAFLLSMELAIIIGEGDVNAESVGNGAYFDRESIKITDMRALAFKLTMIAIGAVVKIVGEIGWAWFALNAVIYSISSNRIFNIIAFDIIFYRAPMIIAAFIAQLIGTFSVQALTPARAYTQNTVPYAWNIVTYLFGFTFAALFIILVFGCSVGVFTLCERRRRSAIWQNARSRSPPPGMPTARGDVVMVM